MCNMVDLLTMIGLTEEQVTSVAKAPMTPLTAALCQAVISVHHNGSGPVGMIDDMIIELTDLSADLQAVISNLEYEKARIQRSYSHSERNS